MLKGEKYIEKYMKDNNIKAPECEGGMGVDIMDGLTIKKVRTMIRHYMKCDYNDCCRCKCNERLPNSKATVCTILSLFKEELINNLSNNI